MAPKRNSNFRTNAHAVSVAELQEEVLIAVLGLLELNERHRTAARVCRRWHCAANSAHLLRCLDISLDGGSAPYAQNRNRFVKRLRSLAEWLAVRAAPHVQQLGLELLLRRKPRSQIGGQLEAEVMAAVPAMLAACAAGGKLTSLRLRHDCEGLPVSSWLAGLGRSLQQLTVISEHSMSVSWLALPVLRELSLDVVSDYLEIDAPLPSTLTKLCLGNLEGEDELPPQIGTLTRLLELRISDSTFVSNEYAPLAGLSANLTRLDLDSPYSLPDCLGQLSSLQALVVTHPRDEDEESLGGILKAALPPLTCLTHLELSSMAGAEGPPAELASLGQLATFAWHGPAPGDAALPGGPWLASLRSVQGPPALLASSLQQLAAAEQLSELVVMSFDSNAAAAAVEILRWAAHRPTLQSLALRSDSLPHEVFNAAVWLKGLRPDLRICSDP